MIVRTTLLFFGLVSLVSSYCICSQSYTKTYPTFVIQSAYDNVTYDYCPPSGDQCTVVINQNDPQKGAGEFVVTEFDGGNGSLFTVVIKDGNDTAFSFTRDTYPLFKDAMAKYKSFHPIVTVLLQYNGDTNVVFNMNGYPTGLAPPPSETTPVTQPPTGGPAGFLGVDLAFAFDSTGSVPTVFATMKSVIKDAVSQLTVTEDVTQPYGARLSLQSVSSANQANNLAVPWAVTREEFRIYAIFTQHDPDDEPADLKPILDKLVARDVHLVVHWFGSTPSKYFPTVALPESNIAYLPYTANSTDFYDKYVLNGDSDQNFGCALVKNYQLEIEKDYARFYDAAGVEVASLTGNNVFGAQFQINGTTGSVRLTTNEYLVYNGLSFTVTTKTGDNPSCDPSP
ncbi:unnamed protein product, partial [Mesorhabditis spiculigera]